MAYACARDDVSFPCVDGIWRFLPPALARNYEPFMHAYETVRRAEGREQPDAYYRALPFASGPRQYEDVWRIRAGSFRALMAKIVTPLAFSLGYGLRVLDLGAGTGWLSYRLAQAGHQSAAVDLLTNSWDGLGAWKKFGPRPPFVPVQATFARLPFVQEAADLVVFNGAIHYARDYATTVREALQLLHHDGQLVIMDSPFYKDARSGAQMVREKEAAFANEHGVDITALPAENFLTPDHLQQLSRGLAIHWRLIRPFRGIRWALNRWRRQLRGWREPADFPLIVGQR